MMIGYLQAFLKDGNVMEYHLSATTPAGRNLGATNLLLDAAAHLGQEQGCSFLYLGGGRIRKRIIHCFSLRVDFQLLPIHFNWIYCF